MWKEEAFLPLWPASRSHRWTVDRESVCRIWQRSSNTWQESSRTITTLSRKQHQFIVEPSGIFLCQELRALKNYYLWWWYSPSDLPLFSGVKYYMAVPNFNKWHLFLTVEELNISGGVFHHEFLIVEGLRIHQALGMGSALVRVGGWRDDSPGFSWILGLAADKFLLGLDLE